MRMSRSPQNGGFHRCTGGGPFLPAVFTAPAIASRPVFVPWSAIVWNHAHHLAIVQSVRYPSPAQVPDARSRERDVHIGNRTEPNMAYPPTGYENYGAFMPQSWRDVCIIPVHRALAAGGRRQ